MKIIDLYNIVANGEELPKRIKWRDTIFRKCDIGEEYYCFEKDMWFFKTLDSSVLNDEIEIIEEEIEEEKKIPEKLEISNFPKRNNSLKKTAIKLNQVIDYLKSKGE